MGHFLYCFNNKLFKDYPTLSFLNETSLSFLLLLMKLLFVCFFFFFFCVVCLCMCDTDKGGHTVCALGGRRRNTMAASDISNQSILKNKSSEFIWSLLV